MASTQKEQLVFEDEFTRQEAIPEEGTRRAFELNRSWTDFAIFASH